MPIPTGQSTEPARVKIRSDPAFEPPFNTFAMAVVRMRPKPRSETSAIA